MNQSFNRDLLSSTLGEKKGKKLNFQKTIEGIGKILEGGKNQINYEVLDELISFLSFDLEIEEEELSEIRNNFLENFDFSKENIFLDKKIIEKVFYRVVAIPFLIEKKLGVPEKGLNSIITSYENKNEEIQNLVFNNENEDENDEFSLGVIGNEEFKKIREIFKKIEEIKEFENFFINFYKKLNKVRFLFGDNKILEKQEILEINEEKFDKNDIIKAIPKISGRFMFEFFDFITPENEAKKFLDFKINSFFISAFQIEKNFPDKQYYNLIKNFSNINFKNYDKNIFAEIIKIKLEELFDFDAKNIKNNVLEKFGESELLEIIFNLKIDKKIKTKIINIIFELEKIFIFNFNEDFFQELLENTDKLDDFLYFLKNTNTKNISVENFIFIFENNLFNEKIITQEKNSRKNNENIENIKKTIKILGEGFLEKFKKMDLEVFKKIFSIPEIFSEKEKLKNYLENFKNLDKILELENLKENLKQDLFFLDKKEEYYKQLEKLLSLEDIEDFKEKVKKIYSENNLVNLIKKNKEIFNNKEEILEEDIEKLYFLKGKIRNISIKNFRGNNSKKIKRQQKEKLDSIYKKIFSLNDDEIEKVFYVLEKINFEKNTYLEDIEEYLDEIKKYDIELIKELLGESKNFSLKKLYEFLNNKKVIENYREKLKEFYDDEELEIIFDNSEDNYKKLELFLKIGKILDKENREDFLLFFDDFNLKLLENIFNFLYFLSRYNLENFLFNDILEKIDFTQDFIEENLEKLYNKFQNINLKIGNKDKEIFIKKLLEFLITGNLEKIEAFVLENEEKIKLKNNLDKKIFEILEEKDKEKIEKIVLEIQKFLENILGKFNTSITSSTKSIHTKGSSDFGKGSGSYTRSLGRILKKLKKEGTETDFEYLSRIKIINFHTFYNDSFITDKRINNIINNAENKFLGFFEALENFSENVIEKIKTHNKEDISRLPKYFDEIIKEELENIDFL